MIRLLLADDHQMTRNGLTQLLEHYEDVEVLGAVADGHEVVTAAERGDPQVILMDLEMPGMDGVEATRRILSDRPQARILVLTSYADRERIGAALDAGAWGYLLKDAEAEDLMRSIRAAANGDAPAPPRIATAPQPEPGPDSTRQLDAQDLGRHIDRLYRAAWALCGSREDAEDLVQETYARVLARPRFLRSDDDLGYLLRVLRHTFVSSLRTRDRRPRTDGSIDEAEIVDLSAARRPDELAETRAVYTAISALPPEFRDALVAVDVVGLSYREAASHLGVKEATLTTRLYRARERVIAQLEPTGKKAVRGGVKG